MAITGLLKKKKKKEIEEFVHPVREGTARPPDSHDESNWLVSYADMMTLLCGFFIMLFSMSTLKKPEYDRVKTEVQAHFQGIDEKITTQAIPLVPQPQVSPSDQKPQEPPIEVVQEKIEKIVKEAQLEKEIEIRKDAIGVSIVFQSAVFFDSGSAVVREEGRQVLSKMIDGIHQEELSAGKNFKFVIEGHTDSRPVLSGEYASNWELSSARATQVLRQFLVRGFEPSAMLAVGYAGTRPEQPERDDSGRLDESALSKNRRVIVRVLPAEAEVIPWNLAAAAASAEAGAPPREPASTDALTPAAGTPIPQVSPAH